MSISEHEFGGKSTDLKLAVVEGYLKAFATALSKIFQNIWYIDAFAGTGERTEFFNAQEGNLFDPATPERVERHRGSAKIAIDVKPNFKKLIFIEKDPKHCAALRLLRDEHPNRDIEIKNGTADNEIRALLTNRSWTSTRAVIFLDSYGMQVSWETLEQIQKTHAVDVWYLVSLSGLFRQAALNAKSLDKSKREAITRMVGTDRWEAEWYQKTSNKDLFGDIDENNLRTVDAKAIEDFFGRRLAELFPKVLKPLPLKNSRGVQIFSLFFAISNPDPKAIGLATKIANHMLKAGSSSQVLPR